MRARIPPHGYWPGTSRLSLVGAEFLSQRKIKTHKNIFRCFTATTFLGAVCPVFPGFNAALRKVGRPQCRKNSDKIYIFITYN